MMVEKWLKNLGIKIIKTMAETGLALIGTTAVGITDVDWLGVGSAMLLSAIMTVFLNLKDIESED